MSERDLDLAKKHRDTLLEVAKRLNNRYLEELERRGWQVADLDGYRGNTRPGIGSAGGSEDTPVERAALGNDPKDSTGANIRTLFHLLEEAAGHAQGVNGKIDWLENNDSSVNRERHLIGAGDCAACGTYASGDLNDRLRAGYCPACNMAWTRAGRPDRATWNETRRAELAEPA